MLGRWLCAHIQDTNLLHWHFSFALCNHKFALAPCDRELLRFHFCHDMDPLVFGHERGVLVLIQQTNKQTNTGVFAPWIARDPNFVAGILEREPFKPPIGVRPKPTMHTSAPMGLAIKRNFKICYKPPPMCQFLWFQSSISSLGLLQPRKSWDILLVIILTKEILQLVLKRYHLPRLIRSYVFIETNRTSCHVTYMTSESKPFNS